jgi:hypothetical protein
MFDTFFGLPLHPLVVHATEVIVPAAAVMVVLTATWPRFRRWAGYLTIVTALVALALVPISKESGERLEARIGENALVETHAELADGLLPWVIGLSAIAAALLWWNIRERRVLARQGDEASRSLQWVPIVLLITAVIVAAGTITDAVLIGHSGATAVWSGEM